MTDYISNAEGGTANGAAVTNTLLNASSTPNTGWVASKNGTGALTFDTSWTSAGTYSYHVVASAASDTALIITPTFSASNNVTVKFMVRFQTLPGVATELVRVYAGATVIAKILITSANKFQVQDAASGSAYSAANVISTATALRVEFQMTVGTTTANGTCQFAYFAGRTSTSAIEASGAITGRNFGTTAADSVRIGKNSVAAASIDFNVDEVIVQNVGTALPGPYVGSPTAAFTSQVFGHTVLVDGSGSAPPSGATLSTYDWDWGDATSHGSGVTPAAHRYTAAGTYTVVLTVTDSNTNTGTISHSVVAVDGSTSAYLLALTTSTGWTASSGTALAAISDTDSTTFISAVSPTSLPLEGYFNPLTPPPVGMPFVITLVMDRLLSASGSVNAQIFDFDGTTQRSAVSGVAVQDMTTSGGSGDASSGTVLGTLELVFPYTDVVNVGLSGWDKLTIKMQDSAA